MSTQEKDLCRAEIIRDLYHVDDAETLTRFKQMLRTYVENENIINKPYTFDELMERIEEGERQEEEGLLASHEDVMAKLRKRIAG